MGTIRPIPAIPPFIGPGVAISTAAWPFLYIYTKSLTEQNEKKKFQWLHFIPFFLSYLLVARFLISPVAHKILVYQNEGNGYEKILILLQLAMIPHGLTYIVLSILLLKKHQNNILHNFSNTSRINLNWLLYLISGMSIIWLAVMFASDQLIFYSVVVFVLFLGYFGIKQVGIFSNNNNNNIAVLGENATETVSTKAKQGDEATFARVKYEKSKLEEAEMEKIHKSLVKLMDTEKIYENAELTLAEVAEKLGVHFNFLSQVINTMEKRNFYEYINTHRVEAFKAAVSLPENQKFTLLSIAMDCGFNSKSSFNRNFKRVTGLSPSEYLVQSKINLVHS